MNLTAANDVGKQLAKAGRLRLRPLCVYSPDKIPAGTARVGDLIKDGNRCLCKAIILVAGGEADSVSASDGEKGLCFGAMCFLGYAPISKPMMVDIAVGEKGSTFLLGTADVCNRTVDSMGKVTPAGKHIVVSTCQSAGNIRPLSYLCFGSAEQIRNLCGLVYFSSGNAFGQIDAPWGTGCELFVTYPAGMASGAPKGTVFIGPNAADGNAFLPSDMMVMGIPAEVAERMAADVDRSFLGRRPEMAYPESLDLAIARALKRLK